MTRDHRAMMQERLESGMSSAEEPGRKDIRIRTCNSLSFTSSPYGRIAHSAGEGSRIVRSGAGGMNIRCSEIIGWKTVIYPPRDPGSVGPGMTSH